MKIKKKKSIFFVLSFEQKHAIFEKVKKYQYFPQIFSI